MADPTAATRPAEPFNVEPGRHCLDLNRRPYVLKHALAGHPLFTLERLAQLAEFLQNQGLHQSVLYRKAALQPHTMGAWDGLGNLPSVGDVIRGCESSGAWVALHDTELHEDYRAFLHDVVGAISIDVGRDLLVQAEYVTGHIFIGSPNSVTDYHMDSETNFLVIISGEKDFHLFDGDDPSILSQSAIENFYWGSGAGMKFDPASAAREMHVHLGPGDCLHVPVNFPHWVQNGPAPCIALSVLLYLPENVDRAHAYQASWLWRRLGLKPAPLARDDHAAARRRGRLLRVLSRKVPLGKRDVIASGKLRLKAPFQLAKRAINLIRGALPLGAKG